jgi:hypothetical protein
MVSARGCHLDPTRAVAVKPACVRPMAYALSGTNHELCHPVLNGLKAGVRPMAYALSGVSFSHMIASF